MISPRPEHIAISVCDLDRSIAFYRDLLGLEVQRVVEAGPESGLGEIVGLPGCEARIAHLAAPEGGAFVIELFQYLSPTGRPQPSDRTQADVGITHIGFASDDARAIYQKLQEQKVECLGAPFEFRPGVWVFYFRGPDGEVCEVRESQCLPHVVRTDRMAHGSTPDLSRALSSCRARQLPAG